MIPEILFWLSLAAIFHSYLLFPLLLNYLARNKKENTLIYLPEDELPFVSVILPVHNEDQVIMSKIKSIYHTSYPLNRFEVLIGSDASTDNTNLVCKIYSENYESLHFFPFSLRQGKPGINNQLIDFAKGNILIMTDAQAFFKPGTIYELVKNFLNPDIDMVGGNIINEKVSLKGISLPEKAFMTREIKLKYQEGLIWGKTMGVYGAIYAIRKKAVVKVPENYSVDDFYITMAVLRKNRKVILNLNAIATEEVPDNLRVEFIRKIRISAGNYQNLGAFINCLIPPWSSLAYIFFSHKVLRWTGPLFLILILFTNIILTSSSVFYKYLLFIQGVLLLLPVIDLLLRKFNYHIILLRFITHFYAMNFALIIGFFQNITGRKTNIWQPTRR